MQDRFKFRIAVFERHNTDEWEFDKFIENTDKLGVSTNGNVIQESVQGFIIHLPRDKTPKNVWRTMEVVQSTGLKDKNGKLIYEGDIVKDDFDDIARVKYSSHLQRLHLFFNLGSRKHLDNYTKCGVHILDWIYPVVSLEVIGNIYENPELMKGGV